MSPEFYASLPAVMATLNAIAFVLLVNAVIAIKGGNERRHIKFMASAIFVSSMFLFFYILFHFEIGFLPFKGTGAVRVFYFALLIPHIILAAIVPPLVIRTAYLGIKGQRSKHIKIVKFTVPIWMYVSVTGVMIYVMNYHLIV